MSGDGVDGRHQVRIERCLVEHGLPEPLTADNPLRPGVVLSGVADEHRQQRRVGQFVEIPKPQRQCAGRDGRQGPTATNAASSAHLCGECLGRGDPVAGGRVQVTASAGDVSKANFQLTAKTEGGPQHGVERERSIIVGHGPRRVTEQRSRVAPVLIDRRRLRIEFECRAEVAFRPGRIIPCRPWRRRGCRRPCTCSAPSGPVR